jgi:hypothetical protein
VVAIFAVMNGQTMRALAISCHSGGRDANDPASRA